MFWEHAISRRLMDPLSLSRLQHFSQIVHSTLSSSCNNVFLPAKISIVLELFCAGLHYNLWAIESVIGFQPTVNATIRQPFFTSLQTKNINQIRYKDVIHHHWGHTVEKEDHFSSVGSHPSSSTFLEWILECLVLVFGDGWEDTETGGRGGY